MSPTPWGKVLGFLKGRKSSPAGARHRESYAQLARRVALRSRELQESEEEARRLAHEHAVMAEIGRIISSSLDISQVYGRFAEEAHKLIPFDRISIGVVDLEKGIFTDAYHAGTVEVPGRAYGVVNKLPGSVTERGVRQKAGVLLRMDSEEELARDYPLMVAGFRAGLRTSISVPLVSNDRAIGALHLQTTRPNAYTQRDLALAERIGAQIAGAIANSLLFTQLEQAQRMLHQSEQRLRTVVEAVPIPMLLTRLSDGTVLYANQHAGPLFGFSSGEMIGRKTLDFYYVPADRASAIAELQRNGWLRNREVMAKKADGTPFWVSVSAQPTTFDGQPALLTSFHDITERKRAEDLFKALAQSSPVGMFIVQDNKFSFVNSQMQADSRFEANELLGSEALAHVHPEDRELVRQGAERMAQGEALHPFEFRVITRTGETSWVMGSFAPIEYEGRPATVGTYMDITERKRMEERLKTSLEEREALLDKVQQLYRQERRRAEQMRAINDVAVKISSVLSLDELLPYVANLLHETFGYFFVNIVVLDSDSNELVMTAAAGDHRGRVARGARLSLETTSITGWVFKTGEMLLANDVSKEPRYYPGFHGIRSELAVPIKQGDEVVGVLDIESKELDAFDDLDVSTVQTLASQLAVAMKNAQLFEQTREVAVLEERNRMAREIHDTLAQGLTGIVLQLEAAEQDLEEKCEEDLKEHLGRAKALARESLQQARRSVWNLLPQELDRRTLEDALREEVRRFSDVGREQATFALSGDRRELRPDVQAALLRICQESLINIRRHAQATRVQVDLAFQPDAVTLRVRDNGVGFNPKAQDAGQDGASPARPPDRTGFGLMGMEQRARLLKGSFTISSERGKGTVVEVRIPTA